MLPKKELNIYPKINVNIRAIFLFYFDRMEIDTEGAIQYLLEEQPHLGLNQIDFMCRKIHESFEIIFKPKLNNEIKLSNLLHYAACALVKNRSEWKGSYNRNNITQAFLDFVKKTEISN